MKITCSKIKASIYKIIYTIASPIAFIYRSMLIIYIIFKNWGKIKESDVVIFYLIGGFGHTFHAQEWSRRLWPQKKICIFFVFQKALHNPHVSRVWESDISFIWAPVGWGDNRDFLRGLSSWRYQHAILLGGLLRKLVSTLYPKKLVYDLHTLLANANNAIERIDNTDPWKLWVLLYKIFPAPTPVLPIEMIYLIRDQLNELSGQVSVKRCCMYLRQKITQDTHVNHRSGGTFSDYIPAIKWLVLNGYQVLITGDVVIDKLVDDIPYGHVVDQSFFENDGQLYQIYAAMECDLYIGEVGGGNAPATSTSCRKLFINTYPLGFGWHNSFILYKKFMENGHIVPFDEAWQRFAAKPLPSGVEVINNTPNEILEAVKLFVLNDTTNCIEVPNQDTSFDQSTDSHILKI